MGDRLTDAELIYRLQVLKQNGSQTKAALELKLNRASFRESLAEAKQRGLTAESRIKDPLGEARNEVKRLKAQIAVIHKHNDSAEEIRRVIYGLQEIPPDMPEWLNAPLDLGGPGTPMTMWSDWHYGEVVKKAEVNELNEFNSVVADHRVEILTNKLIALIKKRMPNGVPGMVVMLGGDMITGEIHQELQDTNDEYVQQTLRRLKGVLVTALTRLADEFGNIFVPCVVGNHGRMTLKPRMKGVVHTSYEWNVYTDLEDRLRSDSRIKFYIPDQTDVLFAVHGHRFLLTHGDRMGVKGGDGIIGALGPILRGEFKLRNSEAQIGRDFDTLVIGHWHQYIARRGLIVNNCLKGYDEFARLALRAPATPASQALWFVSEEKGYICDAMEVYVQDTDPFFKHRSKKRKKNWVEVCNS
jgi:predicted phosphodiesterase